LLIKIWTFKQALRSIHTFEISNWIESGTIHKNSVNYVLQGAKAAAGTWFYMGGL